MKLKTVLAFCAAALFAIGLPIAVYAAAGATAFPIAANPTTWTSLGAGPMVVTVKEGSVFANAKAANCNSADAGPSVSIRSGDTQGTPFYTSYVVCVKGTGVVVFQPTN